MLETIWFVLWGVLWAVYFMLDGFDLGLGVLLPFVGKTDAERRAVYEAMGPVWDGNEVWLITAGGVTFAAFPTAYAVMFSSLYTPLMLILFALILRGVAIEYRNKEDSPAWHKTWDWLLFIGSLLPALLFGVAFANIFAGLPLSAEGALVGGLPALINPYGLAGGVLFLVAFLLHGALWLAAKGTGELEARAAALAKGLWPVALVVAVLFLVFTWFATPLFANYLAMPLLLVVPLISVAGLLLVRVFSGSGAWWKAWGASAAFIACCVLFGVGGLYPNLLPSALDPAATLTAFNAASSSLTLKIMLGVALVMVPIVIIYQAWVYVYFRHKVSGEGPYAGNSY